MFTVTGKVCILGVIFMVGLVFLWLCHVCCRNIWHAILMHLESSSRFSRILELSEINRENLRILPPAGTPVTHLAFLTTYVASNRPSAVSAQFNRCNRNRLQTRVSNEIALTTANNNTFIPESQRNNFTCIGRSSLLNSTCDRTQPLIHQNTSEGNNRISHPVYLSVESVRMEAALDVDIRQSTTLTIASANSPPPSYHSTESIMSQPTLQSHHDRNIREFPRQTSDSSETSTQSAPLNITCPREHLYKISEQNIPSTSSSATRTASEQMSNIDTLQTNSNLQVGHPVDDLPPSYEELFGQTT